MKKLIKVTSWKVKKEGLKRSIQLLDEHGNAIDGKDTYWEGHFVKSQVKLPKKLKVVEVIQMTEGHYGHTEFKRFFKI